MIATALLLLLSGMFFPLQASEEWLLLVHDWEDCFFPNDPDPLSIYDTIEVWCHSSNDVIAAQFSITFPPNVVYGDVTYNSAVAAIDGDIESGLKAAFYDCQEGIGWIVAIPVMVLDHTRSMINLVAHPDNDFVIISTCDESNPSVTFGGSFFSINYCVESDTKNSSWGAIKQIFIR